MNNFRITVVNIESTFGEFRQNMENHFKWIKKNRDSHFILFPELSLSGYSTISKELIARKKELEAVFDEFCIHTQKYPEISLAVGCPQFRNGNIYCTASCQKRTDTLQPFEENTGPG
jgi:predicted amidohydrolase